MLERRMYGAEVWTKARVNDRWLDKSQEAYQVTLNFVLHTFD